jgi:O-antigen ligase
MGWARSARSTAHNVYIQWLLQQGAPGALAMVGCVAVILARMIRGVVRRPSQQSLVLSCLGVAAVFAVHGLVDFALETPSMAAFFSAVLGLGYGLAERPAGQGRR